VSQTGLAWAYRRNSLHLAYNLDRKIRTDRRVSTIIRGTNINPERDASGMLLECYGGTYFCQAEL
jgi:hypothetical protein